MTYPTPGPIPPGHDYPGYHPGPQRRTPWLWIALAVAVVIIVVLSAVLIAQSKDDAPTAAPPAAPAPSSAIQPGPSDSIQPPQSTNAGPSMTCDGYTASVDETSQPGWHATINRYGLAYAAPPDWTVAACGVRTGWAQPCPQGQCVIRELGAVATVPNPACTKQNLAIAGVTGSKNPDIRAALDEEMQTVAPIYTRDQKTPNIEYAPIREFAIGPHAAVQTVATVTGIATSECTGPSAFHSIVVTTVPNVEGSVVFVISLREGSTASPNSNIINEMVDTLRSPA
ncbi:hypothetical protein SAMN04489835_5657 [Mycolicibacterium rutilum]|uniref:DUF8017 domain-containing protein n=1 Tax=Mycolicibacterium rutilum TaxID=370526 RepID=A0A1H6M2Q4_MYCRU|nr:hypothetical protein [Mycolicibacterium rutilum]SEH91644.1 hypothetical protein SAMN04489835_5657 [Mycolicibacterium rutilum]